MKFTVLFLLASSFIMQAQSQIPLASDAACFEPSLSINRKTPDNVVIAASPGIYFATKDFGKTWDTSPMITPASGYNFILHAGRKGEIYCLHHEKEAPGSKLLITVSEDGGQHWASTGSYVNTAKEMRGARINFNSKSSDMMVTWTEFDQYGSKDPDKISTIQYATTKDGKKWSDPLRINLLSGNCLDSIETPRGATPVATTDGKLFIAWSFRDKIYMDRSFDKGGMWLSNDISILSPPSGWPISVSGLKRTNGLPTLCVDNSSSQYHGTLFLCWADKRSKDTDVWFSRSHNLGDNWSTAEPMSGADKAGEQFMPTMAIDQATGIIYIAYYDKQAGENQLADLYLSYSIDNGTTFKHKKLNPEPFSLHGDIGDYIGLDAYQGHIGVAWTVTENNEQRIASVLLKQDDFIELPSKTTPGKKK